MRLCFIMFASLFGSACLTADVEPQLTIMQGLYGQLTEACQGDDCLGKPRVGALVGWFDSSPQGTSADGGTPEPRLELRTKANGFYELALDPAAKGYLAIGADRPGRVVWFTSTATSIPRGLARLDWQANDDDLGVWKDVK